MSVKLFYTGFLFSLLVALTGCDRFFDKSQDFPADKIKNIPLFYLSQFGTIAEGPLNTPEVFNRKALKLLDIQKIVIYSKGGKNPEDTLDKITYTYSSNHAVLDLEIKQFDENPVLWTKGKIILNDELNGSSTFNRHFGIDKKISSDFVKLEDNFLIIRNKTDNRKDTTIVRGSFEKPQAIIKSVGSKVLSVELFIPAGSSSGAVKNAFASLKLDPDVIVFAECSVTFTENDRPVESYFLDEHFSQINLLKNWKYNAAGRLTEFNEWNGSNLLKTIFVHYSAEAVPDYFSINSKTYYVHYN